MSLSVEVQELIFDAVDNIEDIICLSLFNKHMFLVSRKRFHKYYMSLRGQLAGHNLVHLESDGRVVDTPPGLYTPEEIDELSNAVRNRSNSSGSQQIVRRNANPMAIDYGTFERLHPSQITSISRIAFAAARDRDPGDRGFHMLHRELVVRDNDYFPMNKQWVLRNSTAKQYVRAQDITLHPTFVHGPYIDVLGFGAIIAARTCWVDRSAINIQLPAETATLYRGPWAGHKFEITTWESLVERSDFSEWTDASPAVNNEMNILGHEALGPNWRNALVNMWHLAFEIGGEFGLGDDLMPIHFV
jgi:hypothetical protein